MKFCGLNVKHRLRWMLLTLSVAIASYVVANGIPFFKVCVFCSDDGTFSIVTISYLTVSND